jgi:Arc/MetJ-type ribon-helix-helix transcriptional regulator
MAVTKVEISLDSDLLECLDRWVAEQLFPDRSRAVEEAVREKLERFAVTRLSPACAQLDQRNESDLAVEGLIVDAGEWPEY